MRAACRDAATAAPVRRLTWEAATQRLLGAATIRAEEWPSTATSLSDTVAWSVCRPFSFIEVISRVGALTGLL